MKRRGFLELLSVGIPALLANTAASNASGRPSKDDEIADWSAWRTSAVEIARIRKGDRFTLEGNPNTFTVVS